MIVKGGNLQESESSHLYRHCRRVLKCLASFHKHPCPLLHSSLLAQQECPSLVSDQWHSVAGHKIILLRCHRSLTLGRILVLQWCWKGLPSGGWWWACWRLGDIPWKCSQCPCGKKNSTPCSCLSSFPMRTSLCLSSVVVSPKFLHLSSQNPRMFHPYLFISYISFWNFHAELKSLLSSMCQ